MTASSPLGGYISFSAADMDEDDPVDVATAYALLGNNAIHLADEVSQVHIKYVSKVSTSGVVPEDLPGGQPVPGTFYRIWEGKAFLRLKSDGTAYKLRLRLGGKSSSSGVVSKFRLVVADNPTSAKSNVNNSSNINVAEALTSSTTVAWLSTTSTTMACRPEQVANATRAFTSRTTGSSIERVTVTPMQVEVWCSSSAATNIPQLHGVLLEDFVG